MFSVRYERGIRGYKTTKVDMVCFSSVGYSVELTFRALAVCSDEGLTLETSAKHYIPQAKTYHNQPLLIKPIFNVLAHAEKKTPVFIKTSLLVYKSGNFYKFLK